MNQHNPQSKHPAMIDDFVNIPSKGLKFDAEKPRVDLLPTFPLMQVAKVLTFGANKYAADNWRAGISYRRLYAATLRHLFAWNDGEDLDPETQLNHIDHAICELLFLRQMIESKPELDDRYKETKNG